MHTIQIYPSLLAADFANLSQEIGTVEKAGADGIHFDVMDGHFVPNISFGAVVLHSIRKITTLPFWVHLMITEPQKFISDFKQAGADGIFVHPEIDYDIRMLVQEMTRLGVQPGMAVNPETKIEDIKEFLPYFQDFLIMTVNPGFGGQKMMADVLPKVKQIKGAREEPVRVHVDGGVNHDTVSEVAKAGTDILVAGSSIFRQKDKAGALKRLRQMANEALEKNE